MSVQTYSTFSADAVTYISKKTLMIAKKSVIFQQLGDKAELPNGNSKTFQYTRYDRLALPNVALTEGTTPTNTSMSISTVSATCDQWGAYVNLSDVVELTVAHPVMVKAIDLMGYQAAETVDREIIEVLMAGTSVSFGGAITVRSSLSSTSTDIMSTNMVRRMVKNLRNRGAYEYDGQDYVGVVDPSVEMDLSADSTFQTAASYSNIKVLLNGEIGKWMGVRWMRSNLIPSLTGVAAETYTTPASPAGTFTAANYRVTTAYYNADTGFLEKLSDNAAIAFSASDSLGGTTPSGNYVFKIFVGAAAGGATATMYVGSETTYGTGFIPASTAFSILAPPASGTSIAGTDIPTSTKVVHFSWVIGKEAYTVVDLQKLQTYVTPKAASDSDPLAQRRKAGWKLMFKAVINNENFLERGESLSAY
jgi:N4-gp56 family major capsid protein